MKLVSDMVAPISEWLPMIYSIALAIVLRTQVL